MATDTKAPTGKGKEISSKGWPAPEADRLTSALVGGVANGRPLTRNAKKQGQ
jgi:hypothetical protein